MARAAKSADGCAPTVSSAKFTRRAFFPRLGEARAQSFFPAPRGSSRAELFSRASGKLARRAFFPRLGEARAQSFFPAPRGSLRAELLFLRFVRAGACKPNTSPNLRPGV